MNAMPGQLWRFERHGATHLAVIASCHEKNLTFWPAVLDAELADESTLVVPPSDTGLLTPLVMWPYIETGTDVSVLDFRIGTLLPVQKFLMLRKALSEGSPLPVQWAQGKEPVGWMQQEMNQVAAFFGM